MKRIILIASLLVASYSVKAQLRVDSLGCTQMGGNILPAYYNTTRAYDATINGSKSLGSLYIRNFSNSASRYGLNVDLETSDSTAIGVNSWAIGDMSSTNLTCGIKGIATVGCHIIGVAGGVEDAPATISCIGVCGSMGYNVYLPTTGMNYYAGYFQGDVRATGSIYGTLLSPSSVSTDENGTTLVATSGDTLSVTDRLVQVGLLQMERNSQDGSLAANRREDDEVMEINLLEPEKRKTISSSQKGEYTQTRFSAVSYGLAADQLQEVFPELVYEDEDGNYSINYIEMVPLLVQSIRELSAEVGNLRQQLGLEKTVKKAPQQASSVGNAEEAETDIQRNISYDLSGRRTANNQQRGIHIQDGKKVVTK